jgi:hypothetical protein
MPAALRDAPPPEQDRAPHRGVGGWVAPCSRYFMRLLSLPAQLKTLALRRSEALPVNVGADEMPKDQGEANPVSPPLAPLAGLLP